MIIYKGPRLVAGCFPKKKYKRRDICTRETAFVFFFYRIIVLLLLLVFSLLLMSCDYQSLFERECWVDNLYFISRLSIFVLMGLVVLIIH